MLPSLLRLLLMARSYLMIAQSNKNLAKKMNQDQTHLSPIQELKPTVTATTSQKTPCLATLAKQSIFLIQIFQEPTARVQRSKISGLTETPQKELELLLKMLPDTSSKTHNQCQQTNRPEQVHLATKLTTLLMFTTLTHPIKQSIGSLTKIETQMLNTVKGTCLLFHLGKPLITKVILLLRETKRMSLSI